MKPDKANKAPHVLLVSKRFNEVKLGLYSHVLILHSIVLLFLLRKGEWKSLNVAIFHCFVFKAVHP